MGEFQMLRGFEFKPGMLVKDRQTGFLWRVPDDYGWTATYWQRPVAEDAATGGILLTLLGPSANVEAPWRKDGRWHAQVALADRNVRLSGATLGEACAAVAEAIGYWPGGATTAANPG